MSKHPFDYQRPTPAQVDQIEAGRGALKQVYDLMSATLPPSRERSLALTKLEEASMWFNKAVVFQPETVDEAPKLG